jgi:APA family basic amino acid/polyamine antiporter
VKTAYARRLGLFDATMVVIGGIIGAGIFLNPAIVAQRLPATGWILGAWGAGGVVAVLGALCFAELGARRPAAGGGYVYLRDTLGALPAFLYGWALLLVIGTGAIAAVAVTFARYAADLFHLPAGAVSPLAIGAILLLTVVNYVGVRWGGTTQNLFTVLKLVALATLIVAGLFGLARAGASAAGTLAPVAAGGGAAGAGAGAPGPASAPAGWALVAAFGTALIPILFSYGGWQQANFIAEEIIEPRRNLPRAILLGVAAVVAVYVLANVAYVRVLGPAALAASQAPASDTMRRVLGPLGGTLIAAGIAASAFGFLNLVILVSPRVYQAMADDGLFFRWAARLHPRWRTPTGALLFQAAWACALLLTGTYGQLLDYVVFGDWIFFGLVVATLFVFRARGRDAADDDVAFRAPGYPVVPGLFVAVAAFVVFSSIRSNPRNAAIGGLLITAGVPVFLLWRRQARPEPAAEAE